MLKQRAYSQDMFYLQKIHSQVSHMGKSTACLLLWGYAQGATQSQERIRRRSWTRKMRPRNMELTGLLLRNTDVVGGKPRF